MFDIFNEKIKTKHHDSCMLKKPQKINNNDNKQIR